MENATKRTKMTDRKPVKHLVLDTCAVIINANLHQLAEHYYAVPQIIDELRSSKARKVWDTLPFEVTLREPTHSGLKAVIDASKQTGDFQSLSLVDMKVLALTYDLHQQYFTEKEAVSTTQEENDKVMSELSEKIEKLEVKKADEDKVNQEEEEEEADEDQSGSDDESDEDDEGWITVDNIDETLKKLGGFEVSEGMIVGCLSTDFALQNVLLSMHLRLVSLLGYRICRIKSYVLRCRTCYNTTSIMTKEFCPQCGHKTLHKCAVTVDENGEQKLHINWQRLASRRGMVYSLAKPKGGKHAVNERLFEDQPMPHLRMAKKQQDPLADGPFSMHDVNSRSAMLGVRTMNNRARQNRNRNEAKRGGRRK